MTGPRIALLGYSIECNRFAPTSMREDFADYAGEELWAEVCRKPSRMLPDLSGFRDEMDRTGAWTPVPLRSARAQPGGPTDQAYFDELMADWEARFKAAGPVDGVFIASHGAALATEDTDPDGTLYAMVRRMVGPDVPVLAVLDLHANISQKMVDSLSVLIGYLKNPHDDIYERGVEAARHMREILGGTKVTSAMVKVPIVAPTISLLTARGPYADLINYGQTQLDDQVMNVSVMAGFAFADSSKNSMAAVVTTRGDKARAKELALDIATRAWNMHERFKVTMTPLEEAVRLASGVSADASKPAILFADVADNPGGGGRGNTTYIIQALKEAGVQGALLGVFNDPALAAEAHKLGVGATFRARFNREETQSFSKPFEADATVLAVTDGQVLGRLGPMQGRLMEMGLSAAIDIGGIVIVVISDRQQCWDPAQLESLGQDIAAARVVIVKSRGHFRTGFAPFFTPERIYEVNCPGLTSPYLPNFDWQGLPRPVYPLDEHTTWAPPSAA